MDHRVLGTVQPADVLVGAGERLVDPGFSIGSATRPAIAASSSASSSPNGPYFPVHRAEHPIMRSGVRTGTSSMLRVR